MDTKKENGKLNINDQVFSVGRRELMKLGVGAGVAAAVTPAVTLAPSARSGERTSSWPWRCAPHRGERCAHRRPAAGPEDSAVARNCREHGSGYVNHNRLHSPHPALVGKTLPAAALRQRPNVDESTRRLVEFTANFSESQMTPAVQTAINYLMLDFLACWFSGFETDPGRAAARLSQRYQMSGDFKSTVFGYGDTTTPEMAAFANGGMGRHSDFDDHNSILVASCIAMGEALHSTGAQVMQAIAIAYEIQAALVGTRPIDSPGHVEFDNWDLAPAVACAAGHLLGLNEDYLANAVSLAILPHMPLYSRIGVQSMWKGFPFRRSR